MATMHFGDTPLIDSARRGRTADVAALLAGGADVNEPITDGSGVTALYVACWYGHTEAVTTALGTSRASGGALVGLPVKAAAAAAAAAVA